MSLIVPTVGSESIEASFIGVMPIEGVRVGNHEFTLDHFCALAAHFLKGGFGGWGEKVPDEVNAALNHLFDTFEKDGKWVQRK